ncbi:hypothetical protein [Methanimicrococcus hongohii]|uniref:hypothetical protein n=1 Tax=Methanimicrococcus hongohii TaxID=3028295 RepID=UPI00292F7A4A|nr:hypothetical protein [Methanimicrococcus sp. Hf6]
MLRVSAHFYRNPLALNFARFAHKISDCSRRKVFVCSGREVSVAAAGQVSVLLLPIRFPSGRQPPPPARTAQILK